MAKKPPPKPNRRNIYKRVAEAVQLRRVGAMDKDVAVQKARNYAALRL